MQMCRWYVLVQFKLKMEQVEHFNPLEQIVNTMLYAWLNLYWICSISDEYNTPCEYLGSFCYSLCDDNSIQYVVMKSKSKGQGVQFPLLSMEMCHIRQTENAGTLKQAALDPSNSDRLEHNMNCATDNNCFLSGAFYNCNALASQRWHQRCVPSIVWTFKCISIVGIQLFPAKWFSMPVALSQRIAYWFNEGGTLERDQFVYCYIKTTG